MHGKGRTVTLIGIGALAALVLLSLGLGVFARQANVADHLPADPMIAGLYRVHPAEKLDAWLERMQALTGEELDPWTELDERVGMSFRDDVLGSFGPEFGFALDLPVQDAEAGGASVFDEMPQQLLERTVLVTGIRNKLGAIRAAGALATLAEAELRVDEERLTVTFQAPSLPSGVVTLHARIDGSLLVVSGSKERVDEASAGFEPGLRLTDGDDFAQVVTHVTADPDFLTYFNLPRIRDWIRAAELDSQMDRMGAFLEDEWMGIGLIYTSRQSGAGVEGAHYGPEATAEGLGLLWSGAHLIPAVLADSLNRLASGSRAADSYRTLADIRTIGTAIESYAIDHTGYPTTAGWEQVSTLRSELEPHYLSDLPTADQWDQPYLLWSDGTSYRIVSRGTDATVDRDWIGEIEPQAFSDSDSDIVFGDGMFYRWPED